MGQYNTGKSGIKVLDRTVSIVWAVAEGPHTLTELCDITGLPRATAHRLATALEVHSILARSTDGKWVIGPALTALASGSTDKLIDASVPIMTQLMEETGESVQLYRLTGMQRSCIAAQEPPSGLKYTGPVGARMPLTAGSAARVFVAFSGPTLRDRIMKDAVYSEETVDQVRQQGWSDSRNEREKGLASVSAPVFNPTGDLVAVLSLSGPSERFDGKQYVQPLRDAARALGARL